jgi:choice-of-anchor A domain-containing protein
MQSRFQSFLVVASVVTSIAGGYSARAEMPSLGEAAHYAVYGSSTEILINNSETAVQGDVALGPGGTLTFTSGGTITGGLYHDAASVINVGGGSQILGGQFLIDVVPIDDDAHSAATMANALLATQTFGSIGNGATIFGNGGLNVINVTTNILLTSGGVLTLFGGENDQFVFNVNGTMTLSQASSIVPVGVLPSQILWNFVVEGQEVLIDGANAVGTILAIERDIRMESGSVTGALISNGDRIKLQAGAVLNYAPIPEPATGLLLFAATAGVMGIRRRTKT